MSIVDIVQSIGLQTPFGQELVRQGVALLTTPQETDQQRRLRIQRERLEQDKDFWRTSPPPPGTATQAAAPAPTVVIVPIAGYSGPGFAVTPQGADSPQAMAVVLDRLTLVAAETKEALRFAREDGVSHPEAIARLATAQEVMDKFERHDLAPEVLVTLSPADRAAVEASMPEIRRARQALHNSEDGSPPTVESITLAAASAGRAATQIRTARAASGLARAEVVTSELPTVVMPQAPAPAAGQAPYSQYAPDMSVDTGCLPCGRAHLGAAAGVIGGTAELARSRGMADPDVQRGIQTVAEELLEVRLRDWTPERIARSPAADREILERYAPLVDGARAELARARSPEDLEVVSLHIREARAKFVRDDMGEGTRMSQGPREIAAIGMVHIAILENGSLHVSGDVDVEVLPAVLEMALRSCTEQAVATYVKRVRRAALEIVRTMPAGIGAGQGNG